MSWARARIDSLVTIRGGGTPQRDNEAYFSGDIPWVTPKDMKTWEIADSLIKITPEAIEHSATNLVPTRTVLLVVRSGILKHSAPVAINTRPVAINQDMKSLQCGPLIIPEFLARFLKFSEPTILSWVRATTADNYSIDKIKELEIPLPPLPEQRRIAAILDQADELRRKRRAANNLLEQLAVAKFRSNFAADAVGSDLTTEKLGRLCDLVRGSSPRPQGDPRYFGGPVPRLMIADITRDGMIVNPSIDSLTAEGARRSRPMTAGSVVMAVSGAVGLPAILAVDACIHDGFVGFRNLDKRVAPEFLYFWLLSMQSENKSKGTGAIWVNLTTDQVKCFEVPVPSSGIQDEFLKFTKELDFVRKQYCGHHIALDALFASLQHRAFSGELTSKQVEHELAMAG